MSDKALLSRKTMVAGLAGLVVLVGAAGLAWGCTIFSRIDLAVTSARPGAEVAVRGENAAANSPVTLRWDSRSAPVAARAVTDGAGAFTTTVKVPEHAPLGVHVLLATDARGDIARGALEVVGAGGERATVEPVFRSTAPAAEGTGWFEAGAAALALVALGALPVLGLALLWRRPVAVRAGRGPTSTA